MQVSLRALWTPKRGNTHEEYEDAFWPAEPLDLHSRLLRFAVADGATETSFARSWAQLLTRAYCRDRLSEKRIRKTLPKLEQEWHSSIGSVQLPWYAEQKLSEGAHATFVGVTLCENAWQATAIGDSCLFQLRGGRLVTSFPMTCSADFNNHPALLSSNKKNWNHELARVSQAGGTWEQHDVFYLMTDAIACWFLKSVEGGGPATDIPDDAGRFDEWVASLRESGMRNDDVTILRVDVC